MLKFRVPLFTAMACAAIIPAVNAEPLPDGAQQMLDAAIRSGNQDRINVIADVARQTYPKSRTEIDTQVNAHRVDSAQQRLTKLSSERLWQGWKGQGELGGSIASGNDNSKGLTAGLQLTKEDINWKHKFNGLVDYHRASGITDRERFNAAYQGQRKLGQSMYAYGLLQWERDRPAGYYERFSEGVGLGVRVIDRPGLTLDVDGGPAFRQTRYTDAALISNDADDGGISGRTSMSLRWDISPTFSLSQDASIFLSDNSTLQSTSSLNSKLFGPLSARLSFDVRHETDPPPGTVSTDTISRMTLLYSF